MVECVVASRLGVVTERGERVEHLLRAEISGGDFFKAGKPVHTFR
jgi:hypothetical protein